MDNNPDYMDYTARYSNSETTFIPLGYKGNVFKSGIYVEIVPLRVENHSKKTHRQLRFLQYDKLPQLQIYTHCFPRQYS